MERNAQVLTEEGEPARLFSTLDGSLPPTVAEYSTKLRSFARILQRRGD